jgi:rhodanese-related sulfurtransferase
MNARRSDTGGQGTGIVARTLTAAAWIGLVGILVGGTHSALKPIQLHPDEPPPTYLPPPGVASTPVSGGVAPASGDGAASGSSGEVSPTRDGQSRGPIAGATPPTGAEPKALGLEITLADAKALFATGVPFIDARSRDEFLEGHVADALWISPDQFMAGNRPEALDYLDPAQPMVIYCGGGLCDASHNLAKLLQQWGYKRTHIMVDGYPKWLEAGEPSAKGPAAYESPK